MSNSTTQHTPADVRERGAREVWPRTSWDWMDYLECLLEDHVGAHDPATCCDVDDDEACCTTCALYRLHQRKPWRAAHAPSDLAYLLDEIAHLSRELKAARERCPVCGHAWCRHDPADGRCDAASEDPLRDGAVCPCGRDLAWMQARIAELSRRALGLCADYPAGDPLKEVLRQIDRLSRELSAALERERRLREALLVELHGADGVAVTEIGPDGVRRLWEVLVQTEARDA